MKVTNHKVYNLEGALVASGYAMLAEYDEDRANAEMLGVWLDVDNSKHLKRAKTLGNTDKASGHGNYLTGIVVAMDITATNKYWIEFQRYHFAQICTGTSTMHRISKFDLSSCFNEYTDGQIIGRLVQLQETFQRTQCKEDYLRLLYSTPAGLEMTNHVVTNYMQLANMYNQRKTHRLPEWREFCQWCLTLPYFTELTGCGK